MKQWAKEYKKLTTASNIINLYANVLIALNFKYKTIINKEHKKEANETMKMNKPNIFLLVSLYNYFIISFSKFNN